MTDQPKLLWHSNAPWAPTGYGAQVKLFAHPLAEHYDLAISAFYGLEGSRLNWEGIPVLPGLGGDFGNSSLVDHAKHWFGGDPRQGIVLTLLDVWVMQTAMASQLRMASWVPVDHDPTPPAVKQFFADSGAIPIAMSRFGEEQLADFDPLYVPHGVDTEDYKPHDQAKVRERLGVDRDAFLVGIVAANKGAPSRKCFSQSLTAFRHFREAHENAHLYLHTTVNAQWAQGEDLLALLGSLEIPEDSVMIADQYRNCFNPVPSRLMAQVYSSFDVLLNPSAGEGFGVPVLEAQACGVPAIVTDFSAMTEVCAAGWKVGCRPQWTAQRSWQGIPDVGEIVGALEECYDLSDTDRAKLATRARGHALNYAGPKVMEEHFLPALQEVEERMGTTPEIRVAA